jgi:hypothetical protein
MAADRISTAPELETRRFVAQRWQGFAAEARVNLLRIIAIGAFYIVHLWSYYSSLGKVPPLGFFQIAGAGEIGKEFHSEITLLAVAWAMLALGILYALHQKFFPRWLPYFTTASDVVLLVAVLCIANGPRSPLVAGFFLVLVLASIRLNITLIRFTTICCGLGYLAVLGYAKWSARGQQLADEIRVPRYHEVIVLLAILLAGVMLGQVVRTAWRLFDEAATRT